MNQLVDIIFISRGKNRSLGLKLPVWFILMLVITLFTITVSTAAMLLRQTGDTIARFNLVKVERDNRALCGQLAELKKLLAETETRVDNSIAHDNRQRTYWQMPYIHQDVWSMGIGGVKQEVSIPNITKATNRVLGDVYETIEILKSRCQLREKSLGEINGQIDKKYQLWSHIPAVIPLPGKHVGSAFGYRVDPITKAIRMHEGIDVGAPTGTPIYAAADGIVKYSGWNMGYGLNIDIDHGYGFVSRYAHCHSLLVKAGDVVKRGQVIATVGATGRVTCPHLHYEVHVSGVKINPANYIDFSDFIVD